MRLMMGAETPPARALAPPFLKADYLLDRADRQTSSCIWGPAMALAPARTRRGGCGGPAPFDARRSSSTRRTTPTTRSLASLDYEDQSAARRCAAAPIRRRADRRNISAISRRAGPHIRAAADLVGRRSATLTCRCPGRGRAARCLSERNGARRTAGTRASRRRTTGWRRAPRIAADLASDRRIRSTSTEFSAITPSSTNGSRDAGLAGALCRAITLKALARQARRRRIGTMSRERRPRGDAEPHVENPPSAGWLPRGRGESRDDEVVERQGTPNSHPAHQRRAGAGQATRASTT